MMRYYLGSVTVYNGRYESYFSIRIAATSYHVAAARAVQKVQRQLRLLNKASKKRPKIERLTIRVAGHKTIDKSQEILPDRIKLDTSL